MTTPLSIASLSHLASPGAPSGAERSQALLAIGLAARGHRVSLFTPGRSSLDEQLTGGGIEIVHAPCRMAWLTQGSPTSPILSAARWIRFSIPDPGEPRLDKALRALAPDVVHVNCLPHVRGARAARRVGAPVVWHVREILPPGWRRRWFASALAETADAVVAVSEAVASWIREEGLGDRVRVVPNGIDPEGAAGPSRPDARRRLALGDDACVVGLLGQLVPHKGALEFVRAASLAWRVEPSLRFLVAGDGPARFASAVDRAIRTAGASPAIRRVEGQRDVASVYRALDVVALATVTPDPLPRTVLEAMGHGLPVVAFRSGGAPEMVVNGETGILCDVGDTRAMADAFVALARDETARRRLGTAGALRAREAFSLRAHVDRMEALLAEVATR